MSSIVSEMISNKIHIALADGIKSYIKFARIARKVTTAIIVLQGLFYGIGIGILLMVMSGLFSGREDFRSEWALFIGLSIAVLSVVGLCIWNSETAWARRLKLNETVEGLIKANPEKTEPKV